MAEEVAAWIRRIPQHAKRSGFENNDSDPLLLCRRELARLIHVADPSRIVLCKNATEALNIAFYGCDLRQRVVLVSAAEHNSVLRPLYLMETRGVLDLKIVPCDRQGRVLEPEWHEMIERFSPYLVVLTHASNITGAINDVAGLFSYAREKGSLTLLDASQTLGLVEVDSTALGADMVAFTGHKYLLGPPGTGGLYVRSGIELEPFFVGGTGVRSDLHQMPEEMPDRLEPGTPSTPLFAGLLHSLLWQRETPPDRSEMGQLLAELETGLEACGAQPIKVSGDKTGIVSFRLPGWNVDEAGYVLARSFDIICRTGLHCAPLLHTYIETAPSGTIRFSISRFSSAADIAAALAAVRKMKSGAV